VEINWRIGQYVQEENPGLSRRRGAKNITKLLQHTMGKEKGSGHTKGGRISLEK